jgi:hypothetical protein
MRKHPPDLFMEIILCMERVSPHNGVLPTALKGTPARTQACVAGCVYETVFTKACSATSKVIIEPELDLQRTLCLRHPTPCRNAVVGTQVEAIDSPRGRPALAKAALLPHHIFCTPSISCFLNWKRIKRWRAQRNSSGAVSLCIPK